jgi:hypothetical protein
MEEQKNNFNKLIPFLIVFFLMIVLGLFFFGLKLTHKKEIVNPSPQQNSKVELTNNGELTLKKNDDFNYQIIAASNNHNITGFDLLIEVENPTDLEAINFFSPLPAFSLYQVKKGNFLILTGIKKLNFDQKVVFQQTPIVNLKTTKILKINLKSTWGKYTTKLVDSQNNVLNPKIILK